MSGRGDSSKRLSAAAFVGVLGIVLALTLAMPGARSPLREPLVPKASRGVAVTIPLEGRESRKRTTVHRLALSVIEPDVLLGHEELHLFFACAPARRDLVRAELRARAASCVLETSPRRALVDGQPVVFRRTGSCAVERAAPADLDLTVELEGQGTLALLGFEPVAGAGPGPIQVPVGGVGGPAYDVRGAYVDYTPPAPRIELLSDMWRLGAGTRWLWLSLAAGVGLAFVGCLIFPTHAMEEPFPSARRLTRAGGAAVLLAGSLGILYAVLVPPLMGPDEPYHVLGFADLASDQVLARDTVAWMGETHLWRIRYQPTERYRTIDVGRPYVVEDDQLRATEVAQRSALLARLWEAAAPFLPRAQAPRVLLTLRLLNVLVFAVAVGLATAFAVATVDEPFPQWLVFPFLFVPALPFFAMHVSETALLCSSYVLLAAGVAVLFLDGARAHWAGIPLGLGTGLMLAGGRSPWPLGGLVGTLLLGRVLLGSRAIDTRRAALVFWAGFAAGAAVLFALRDEAYRGMTDAWIEGYTTGIPVSLRKGGVWLLAHPAAMVVAAVVAAVVEVALRSPRAWVAARLAEAGPRLVRRSALALAGFVLISLVGSLVVSYPQLELEPKRVLTATERVTAVLATMATTFRLSEPNFLLSTSFWVGFGWLDTSPQPWFEAGLALVVAGAFVLLLRHIAQRAGARRLLWLLLLAAGSAIALVLYTLTTQVSKPLHGRYLIGWYLCLLTVIFSALTLDLRAPVPSSPPSGAGRAALLLATAGLIHAYCLCFILARYF